MKITIEIDDEEIAELVKAKVVERLVEDIYGKQRMTYEYKRYFKEVAREVLRDHFDALADSAVQAAAITIANRTKTN